MSRLPPPRLGSYRLSVGVLGGSFNPAHAGHRHISLVAQRRLRLDQVWWLVSPQNPLKPTAGMAPFSRRLAVARQVADHPLIRVTDLEADLGTRYTAETLPALTARFPRIRFVWLMGADNLVQIPKWESWTTIFHTAPVAVFARDPYAHRALAGRAARRFARSRVPERAVAGLPRRRPPAWAYLHMRRHPASATAIRTTRSWVDPGPDAPEQEN